MPPEIFMWRTPRTARSELIDMQGVIMTAVTVPIPQGLTFGADGLLYVSTYSQIFHVTSAGTVTVSCGNSATGLRLHEFVVQDWQVLEPDVAFVDGVSRTCNFASIFRR